MTPMIRFHLKCDHDHQFESWFQSGEAYDKLSASGLVNCAACGSTKVSKSVMAPAISTSTDVAVPKRSEAALAELRAKVEATADYVGGAFVKEARDMHDGTIPERPIYGEANLMDARKLVEDGIPVMPLPFIPRKKTN
jgi:hypothetical protein